MNQQWKNNPNLNGIDEKKLEFLSEIASQTKNANKDSLLPLLLGLSNKANSNGINFSKNESEQLINILSAGMSSQELKQLESIKKMADIMSKNQRK